MLLKDRLKKRQDEKEEEKEKKKLWYDRAFGSLRNIMKIQLSFTPPPEQVIPGKFLFLAKIHYEMFPEMTEEFDQARYPENQSHIMQVDHTDENTPEYFLDLEVPYGNYKL